MKLLSRALQSVDQSIKLLHILIVTDLEYAEAFAFHIAMQYLIINVPPAYRFNHSINYQVNLSTATHNSIHIDRFEIFLTFSLLSRNSKRVLRFKYFIFIYQPLEKKVE